MWKKCPGCGKEVRLVPKADGGKTIVAKDGSVLCPGEKRAHGIKHTGKRLPG